MSKSKGKEVGPVHRKVETTWSEVAKVAVKRGVTDSGDTPLMLGMSVGSGELPNGREFDVTLNVGSGSINISFHPTKNEKGKLYSVNPKDILDAILASEEGISLQAKVTK
jgi:hypothetical protein